MKKLIILCSFLTFFFMMSCSGDKKSDEKEQQPDTDTEETADADEENSDSSEETPDSDAETHTKSPDFSDGPYGTSYGDIAGDFTLPTDSGEWNFAENFSKDESCLFIFRRGTNSTSTKIWTSQLFGTFDSSVNAHFFFIVDTDNAEQFEKNINVIKETIQEAYDMMGNDDMKKRMHIVEKPASELDSWLTEWLGKYPDFFFGIDHFQKIRAGGSFSSWDSSSLPPQLDYVRKEGDLYDYEKKIADFIEENSEKMIVAKGLEAVPFAEDGWTKDLFFTVSHDGLDREGKLYILLEQRCGSPKECEWDRLERLFLCSSEENESCTTEIGRWITTYGRSGKWLTDITPLKPLIEKAGSYRFRFTVDGDNYTNDLSFLFVPEENTKNNSLMPLFSQTTPFDEEHNSKFEPIELTLPDGAKGAKIVAYITGHGNGSEAANCAEFCQFESVFTLNGKDFTIDFTDAGSPLGCFDKTNIGVVPNQYGSWPYGRAGWCPGSDVKMIEIDVTDALASGENTFSYAAYLNGEVYVPVVTDPNGYRAEIYLSSYLAVY